MIEAIACFGNLNKKFLNYVKYKNIYGFVLFTQLNKNEHVNIYIKIYGLSDGYHGFHIHNNKLTYKILKNNSDCCKLLGPHFNSGNPSWSLNNPNGTKHGCHTGDLCFNIKSYKGKAIKNYIDKNISLYKSSPNYIINRSLVIHESKDDKGKGNNTESLISGNAKSKIACANIYKIKNI